MTLGKEMAAKINLPFEGKRALIELREGRRWHHMAIAILKEEDDGLYVVFREPYPKHYQEPAKLKIPEKLLSSLEAVAHPDYEFRLQSVLLRRDTQTDDECAWVRPPIIVTQADIDAAKNERA